MRTSDFYDTHSPHNGPGNAWDCSRCNHLCCDCCSLCDCCRQTEAEPITPTNEDQPMPADHTLHIAVESLHWDAIGGIKDDPGWMLTGSIDGRPIRLPVPTDFALHLVTKYRETPDGYPVIAVAFSITDDTVSVAF